MEEVKEKTNGRPSDFTQELADKLCERLALGESMRTVCANDWAPSIQTVFSWIRTKPGFLDQYARAKQEAADAMSEDILDISDEGTNDWMEKSNSKGKIIGWEVNGEAVQRSKLRVDTRKWLMSKMKPKKYADKIDLTTNGKDLPTPILGYVQPKHSDKEGNADAQAHPGSPGRDVSIQDDQHLAQPDPPSAVG